MLIGVKGKQLCDINHFQLSMHCDFDIFLLTQKSIGYILNSYMIGSLCMKFHDDRCKGKAIMQHKPFSVINAL